MLEIRGAGADSERDVAAIRRRLGLAFDPRPFAAACASLPWLAALAATHPGVRPARFPTLWEAAVNALLSQSVSMASAAAVMDRVMSRWATHLAHGDAAVEGFPSPRDLGGAPDAALRAAGLSGGKIAALRAVARALERGEWDPDELAARATPELCAALVAVHGIGPWSAAVIALRGFGRVDVFPPRDTGVARTVAELAAAAGTPVDGASATAQALAVLGDDRGMLYHLLLLDRHARAGRLGESDSPVLAGIAPRSSGGAR